MSYSLKQILSLEKEINKNLPLSALPSSRLIEQCKESGIKIKRDQLLKIDKVTYVKKEGDIFCNFYNSEAKKGVFTSIVNLIFRGKGTLFEKIKKFQSWDGSLE